MDRRNALEFAVGLVAAGAVTAVLASVVRLPYALSVGLAAGTPSLVRTSIGLDRGKYEAAKSGTDQVVDGALAAAATGGVGLAGGYLAISNGYTGPVAAAVAAAVGVFAGQTAFYLRNSAYVE